MARLVFSINVTLDGCVDHVHSVADDEHHEYALAILRKSTALVLGRNTYELFASYWPEVARTGDGPPAVVALARELDAKPRYVVSSRLGSPDWAGTVVLSGDLGQEIRSLKQREPGDLLVFGSPGLARSLAKLGEIDEFQFVVQPMVVAQEPRLFGGLEGELALELVGTRPFRSGAVLHRYLPAR